MNEIMNETDMLMDKLYSLCKRQEIRENKEVYHLLDEAYECVSRACRIMRRYKAGETEVLNHTTHD